MSRSNSALRGALKDDPSVEQRLKKHYDEKFGTARARAGMAHLKWARTADAKLDARGIANAVNARIADYHDKFGACPEPAESTAAEYPEVSAHALRSKMLDVLRSQIDYSAANVARYRKETGQAAKLGTMFAVGEVLTQASRLFILVPKDSKLGVLHGLGEKDWEFGRQDAGGVLGAGLGMSGLWGGHSAHAWRKARLRTEKLQQAHEILTTETPTEV